MHPAGRKKHRLPRLRDQSVKAVSHLSLHQTRLKFLSSHPPLQPGINIRPWLRLQKEPHLGFGISPQLLRHGSWRMNLQGQLFLRIQQFNQNRKPGRVRSLRSKNFFSIRRIPIRMKGFPAAPHHRLRLRPVHQLPSLPDLFSFRQHPAEALLQISATPDPLLGQRLKFPNRHTLFLD